MCVVSKPSVPMAPKPPPPIDKPEPEVAFGSADEKKKTKKNQGLKALQIPLAGSRPQAGVSA